MNLTNTTPTYVIPDADLHSSVTESVSALYSSTSATLLDGVFQVQINTETLITSMIERPNEYY